MRYNWSDHPTIESSTPWKPAVSFSPIQRLKIADQVAHALRDAILGGRYEPGDPLPSERSLADQFGVNRGTIREGIHRLEAWGLVEVRQGGSTRVRDFLASAGLQLLPWLIAPAGRVDPTLLADLLELRVALLAWTAGRAAERHSDAQLDALRDCLKRLDAATSPAERGEADWDFFEVQVAMTGNRVLALLGNAMRRVYDENTALFSLVYAADPFDTALHHDAVAAIAGQDATAAADAMRAYGARVLRQVAP